MKNWNTQKEADVYFGLHTIKIHVNLHFRPRKQEIVKFKFLEWAFVYHDCLEEYKKQYSCNNASIIFGT